MTDGRSLPRLHVITEAAVLERPGFLDAARDILAATAATAASGAAGPKMALHLRGKIDGRLLHDLAIELLPVAHAAGVLLLINDRIDIARAVSTDGVQLGQGSLSVADARLILESDSRWVGVSAHGGEEARIAAGADFLIVGNIWETPSHPERAAAGTERLAQVAQALAGAGTGAYADSAVETVPIIAIGGVTPDRVASALSAGAHGVAVLGGIWSAPSPSEAAFRYLQMLPPEPLTRDLDQ